MISSLLLLLTVAACRLPAPAAGRGRLPGSGLSVQPASSPSEASPPHHWAAAAQPLRRLAQDVDAALAADAAAADGAQLSGPVGAPAGEAAAAGPTALGCMDLHLAFGAACQVGIDRAAQHYPRGSIEPPTEEQRAAGLAALAAGFLPTRPCCDTVRPIAAASCGCDR